MQSPAIYFLLSVLSKMCSAFEVLSARPLKMFEMFEVSSNTPAAVSLTLEAFWLNIERDDKKGHIFGPLFYTM